MLATWPWPLYFGKTSSTLDTDQSSRCDRLVAGLGIINSTRDTDTHLVLSAEHLPLQVQADGSILMEPDEDSMRTEWKLYKSYLWPLDQSKGTLTLKKLL